MLLQLKFKTDLTTLTTQKSKLMLLVIKNSHLTYNIWEIPKPMAGNFPNDSIHKNVILIQTRAQTKKKKNNKEILQPNIFANITISNCFKLIKL